MEKLYYSAEPQVTKQFCNLSAKHFIIQKDTLIPN